tara:strand:+ start:104 stop:943 length:840 start_codon:yes stop_codon:yes gene_type:complete
MIQCLIKLVKLLSITSLIIFTNQNIYAKERLVIGATTSTYDSGLTAYIANAFKDEFDYSIHVISQGTGQIINTAMMGNIDILLIHNKKSEDDFVDDGYGTRRYNLMYNDFIIVGPIDDPAKIQKSKNLKDVMVRIYNNKNIFVSRADKSGTYFKELELWAKADIDTNLIGDWYKKVGQGMGSSLNVANSIGGYILVDRSTWTTSYRKNHLKILVEGYLELRNQYSVILVNKEKIPSVNSKWGKIFLEWILSDSGKILINNFMVNKQQLFFFNGDKYINE